MPEDMPDRVPEDMPEHIAEDMPGRMPEDMPDRMPEEMPDKTPEDMSDKMPGDLPVTKRIDVMVGITRSKVIFPYIFSFFQSKSSFFHIFHKPFTLPYKFFTVIVRRCTNSIQQPNYTGAYGVRRPTEFEFDFQLFAFYF